MAVCAKAGSGSVEGLESEPAISSDHAHGGLQCDLAEIAGIVCDIYRVAVDFISGMGLHSPRAIPEGTPMGGAARHLLGRTILSGGFVRLLCGFPVRTDIPTRNRAERQCRSHGFYHRVFRSFRQCNTWSRVSF